MASGLARESVSVALCTYNGEAFVREQLRSILTQSVPVAEVVVGDDGSTDLTLDIIADVAAELGAAKRMRVAFTEPVGGIRANIERTVQECRGDVIALSDQDDVWHEDKVETLLAEFHRRPTMLMLHSDARIVSATGDPAGRSLLDTLGATDAERGALIAGRALPMLLRRNLVTGATAAFRRELLDLALPLAPSWVHDEWLAILAASRDGLALVNDELIDYRVHGANQIGATERTMRFKASRMLEPRGNRLAVLADRAAELVERLEATGASSVVLASARGKREFDAQRAQYPPQRCRRVGPVLRLARKGGYGAYASQGLLDVARDVLQAP
jgi:glycosyltransferase involved in cell wall biosynthesis